MKKISPVFASLTCLCLFLFPAHRDASAADTTGKSEPAFAGSQQVRVDILMLSMPEAKFLAFLPDLLDQERIGKTVPALLEAVKNKEIVLEDYSSLVTKSGQRAVKITHVEDDDYLPEEEPSPPVPETPVNGVSTTTQRPVTGVTIEAQPVVSADGRHIDLNLNLCHTELAGYGNFLAEKGKDGQPLKGGTPGSISKQPQFFDMKTTTALTLPGDQYMLLAVHKKNIPGGYIEIFIVRAEVIPVRTLAPAPAR